MENILKCLLFLFCCCNSKSTPVDPSGDHGQVSSRILANNLNHPWEILWGPDNMIWLTERSGVVKKVQPSNGVVSTIFQVPDVASQGEGGLLGMALHPSFSVSPDVFLAYNYNSAAGYREKIVKYRYNGTTLTNPVVLVDGIDAAGIHNGCRLLIIGDKLFITTGDAAQSSTAQNKNLLNGKVLRINLDGSIPADNPIAGSRIWSWGHRNAQGLVYANNILYSSEHGPDSDDEINIIEKGRNYGWPDVKGICNISAEQIFCSNQNVKEPIKIWTPTIAACGMEYYGSGPISAWKNSLILTTLKGSKLVVMKLNNTYNGIAETKEYFNGEFGRLRDICISPDGKVYISTSNGGNSDKIVEIQ